MSDNPKDTPQAERIKGWLSRGDTSRLPTAAVELARAALQLGDPDLSHADAQSRLPGYVDAVIGGLPAHELYPEVRRHLYLCPACEAEYLELLAFARLEDRGEIRDAARTPQFDFAFLPPLSLPEYVRALAQDLAAQWRPHLVGELRSVLDPFFERLAHQGNRLVPSLSDLGSTLGFEEGKLPDSALLLIATQLTTQTLIETFTPQEVQTQVASGQLRQTVLKTAAAAARKTGLRENESRDFAEQYTQLVVRDPEPLVRLTGSSAP